MGRKKNVKKGSVKSRRNTSVKRKKTSAGDWTGGIVQIYLFVMFGIFPLYYYDRLFHIGTVKYLFFRTATVIMLILLALELFFRYVSREVGGLTLEKVKPIYIWGAAKKKLFGMSFTDCAVLVYLVLSVLSWLLSENRMDSWTGMYGWYMGLLSQLLFVGIYFAVSRFCRCREWMFWVMSGSAAIVFLTAYLHRFSIDPLGLQTGIRQDQQLLFLGTVGQANFHSAYVCVVLSMVMGAYVSFWRENSKGAYIRRSVSALVIFLGFCTAVTQNSDSAYVGLGAAFLFLLWFVLEDGVAWKRYLEVVLLAVSSAKLTGVLQNAFPEKVPDLDVLSFLVTKGWGGWLVLAVTLMAYGITCWVQKRDSSKKACVVLKKSCLNFRVRWLRKTFYALLAVVAISTLLLVWLTTTGKISVGGKSVQKMGYLFFNWNWGSGRGSIWILSITAFCGYSVLRKLFGCGPEMLVHHWETYHGEMLQAMWGDMRPPNAHNEWLHAVVVYGILGGAAYIAIFVSSMVRTVKNRKKHPALLAIGTSISAYMAHNMFLCQQAVYTSLIFIIIGVAESLMRTGMVENKTV